MQIAFFLLNICRIKKYEINLLLLNSQIKFLFRDNYNVYMLTLWILLNCYKETFSFNNKLYICFCFSLVFILTHHILGRYVCSHRCVDILLN